jgi:glutathionylspermidine synthase
MRRVSITPRADWRPGLRKYPFGIHCMPAGIAWREDVRYEFSAVQIDAIESAADELHLMVREAVRLAVERRWLGHLGIRGDAGRLVESSWLGYWRGGVANDRDGGLVGRLTLAYDGRESIKLLGCNYDMPGGLFAASVIQRNWRDSLVADGDQFNSLHEGLVERWEELAAGVPGRSHAHFVCAAPDAPREGELAYLAATAREAGIEPTLLPIQAVSWDGQRFRDMDGNPMSWTYKLYPWEALTGDAFASHLRGSGLSVLEPLWRWAASSHGLLALLWLRYPGHANLCRAGFTESDVATADGIMVRSQLGLDHAAQRMIEHGRVISDTGPVDDPGGFVWMETPPLCHTDGVYAVIDAWIVGDKCLGMSIRESTDPCVGSDSRIVPHIFRP